MDKRSNSKFVNRVQKNYDSLSRFYDFLTGKTEQQITEKAIGLLDLHSDMKLLDIGCGTGSALLTIGRSVTQESVIAGLDISFEMCRKAKYKVEREEKIINASIACVNALTLPFGNDIFDYLMMSFTLEIFPDDLLPQLLAQCRRVLKHFGQVALVCMAESAKENWISRMYRKAHEQFPTIIDCRPLDAERIIAEYGFKIVEKTRMNLFGLPVEIILATNTS